MHMLRLLRLNNLSFHMIRALQTRTHTQPSCTLPCLLHNNVKTQIIMEQTKKCATVPLACSSLQHPINKPVKR